MFPRPPLTRFVRAAMMAMAAALIISAVLTNFAELPIFYFLALSASPASWLMPWQLVTYVLAFPVGPGGLFNFALSMLFFWWIVAAFEDRHGSRRVIELCVVGTLAPALAAVLAAQLPFLGSGVLYGSPYITWTALCADAMLLPPHARLTFFGLFTMRPKQLLMLAGAWAVVSFLMTASAINLVADLAAIGAGYAFARYFMLRVPRRRSRPSRGPVKRSGRPPLRLVRDDDDDDEPPKRWLN